MNDKPFPMHVEDSVTEHVLDQLLKLAETVKATREVTHKDADSLLYRMQKAGYVRREWKQTEEALPALMAEAREDQWTVEAIAETLGVTESYVYRVLREHQRRQDRAQ
ncbi:helix-turn-helix domain-containing protein [Streptomyces sp. NPDC102370]|uniref:helix-turn-helix domain-containing protein n=1 Tax=Streptomyces sp. NPDC102370 TaxID=3366163 RepID=UPI0037F94F78